MNIEIILSLYAFCFGACLGSFFNVCIYRMPNDLSVVHPRSFCPECKKPIPLYWNIPIISYLLLIGKSRCCGCSIAIRYLWIEILTAFSALFLYWHFSGSTHPMTQKWIYSILILSFIVVTMIDFDHMIIPDEISIGGLILGLIFSVIFPSLHLSESHLSSLAISFIGAGVGGGTLLAIATIGEMAYKKEVMGMGDVKLMAMIGAIGGWKIVLMTLFLGSLFGSIAGLALIALKKTKFQSKIPFGPYLALGALISLLYRDPIIEFYLNLVLPNY